MKNFKNLAIGGESAFNYPLALACTPLLIIPVALYESKDGEFRIFLQWIGSAAIATSIAGLLMIFIDKTLFRNRRIKPVPNWWIFALGAFLGFVKGGVTGLISKSLFHIPSITLNTVLNRSINAGAIGALFLPIIALSSYSWHVLGDARKLTIADLEAIELLLGADIDPQYQHQLLNAAKERLNAAKKEFNERFIMRKVQSTNEVAQYLRELSNSVVRKLSREISDRPKRSAFTGTQFAELVLLVPETILGVAPWFVAYSGVVSIRIFLNVYGLWLGLLLFTIHLSLLQLSMWVIYRLLRRGAPKILQVLGIPLLILTLEAWALNCVQSILYGKPVDISPWSNAILNFTSFCLICAAGIYLSTQLKYIQVLKSEYSKKYSEIMRRDQSQRLISTQLARYLHGTLQTRLITSAYRIGKLRGGVNDDELLTELMLVLDHFDLPDNLGVTVEVKNFQDQINSVLEDWHSLLTVSLSMQTTSRAYPPEVQSDVCDIINEALNNALRHGNATNIQIDITDAEDVLIIRCEDNGAGPEIIEPGLGSELFSGATSGYWKLTRSPDNSSTILELRIKL